MSPEKMSEYNAAFSSPDLMSDEALEEALKWATNRVKNLKKEKKIRQGAT